LEEVTTLVAFNDLKSRPDRESNSGEKWIPEANPIHVLGARARDHFSTCFIAEQESIKNREFHTSSRPDFSRSGSTLGLGRRLDKAADKPPPEPSGRDIVRRRIGFSLKRGGNRRQVRFVREANVLKTLPHAPGSRRRLPIQLFLAESCK